MAGVTGIRETVRDRYAAAAGGRCTSDRVLLLASCCEPSAKDDCCQPCGCAG